MQIEEGTLIADKYRLVERLARGGMGSVWTAHHEKLDAEVAIKFMDPELAASDDMRARFEREAKAAAKLRSPHVVQVLDYGVEQGQPFIVMERLHGEDLRTRLRQRQRLGLREGASILNQVCKALRVAAEHGIVHRDLKPANVFIAKSGDDEVVKVLDFGVAKALRPTADGEGTTSGILLGSPHYMSPEQAR
ncbi:MAG: serine/threonine protein kinase, partial [Myxococcales bacterium]|nr:serine/threonine protein kinase [Myxococcales bacterium]